VELLPQSAPRFLLGAALTLLLLVVAAAPASAQQLKFPPSQTKPPPGHTRTAQQVIRIADRQQKVID
jgi:hypothetical protein